MGTGYDQYININRDWYSDTLDMDRTLTLIFATSETIRNIKKV